MKQSSSVNWRHLAAELGLFRRRSLKLLSVVALCSAFQLAFFLGYPFAFRYIFDVAVQEQDLHALFVTLAALLSAFLVASIASILQEYSAGRYVTESIQRLRERMYDKVLRLSSGAYQATSGGELVGRFSNDLYTLETGLVQLLSQGLFHLVLSLLSLLVLFWIEWRLALLTCCLMPVVYLGPRLFSGAAERHSDTRKGHEAQMVSQLQESIAGRVVVRGFGLERLMRERFGLIAQSIGQSSQAALFSSGLLGRSVNISVFLVVLAIVGVGTYLAVQRSITVGTLFAFMALLLSISDSIDVLSYMGYEVVQAVTGAKRVSGLLGYQEEADLLPAESLKTLGPFLRSLSFEGVSFGYSKSETTIEDLSFQVQYGESVALVGPSGCGKSTLLHLLARSFHPRAGRIRLDGQDLREVAVESLRSQVAMVHQDTYLFDTSIGENIRYGRLDASEQEVVAAAGAAGLHEIIESFSKGYDTPVGEGGKELSGGQRQRVAVARALLRKPRILLLDEVTSALDPMAESAINSTLAELSGKLTQLHVTHRLSSMQGLDRILVLDKKRLVESGTHQQLLDRNGVYAQLWNKQSGFHFSDDGRWVSVDKERLRMIPLFSGLDDEMLEELAGRCRTERFPKGETIIEEGQMGTRLFLIVRGQVSVYRTKPGTDEKVQLNTNEVGDYIGEISLVKDSPATANVVSLSPLICLTLDRESFLKLLEQAPSVKEHVLQIIEERTRGV